MIGGSVNSRQTCRRYSDYPRASAVRLLFRAYCRPFSVAIRVSSRFTSENALGSYSSTATVQTPVLAALRPIALQFVGRSFRWAAVDGLLKAALEPVGQRGCHNLRLISSMAPGDPYCWIISSNSRSSILRLLALITPTKKKSHAKPQRRKGKKVKSDW